MPENVTTEIGFLGISIILFTIVRLMQLPEPMVQEKVLCCKHWGQQLF